jgi:NTP pyrophosphatase (non-canonical NTP hydrolase)
VAETQESIGQWLDGIGITSSSTTRCAIRANEEMAELLTAISTDDPKAPEEAADVVIVLFHLAIMSGFDLMKEVDRKMQKNRQRQWRIDSTGHGYHK